MIGIGITTRNRPKVLELCLMHFAKFLPDDALFCIVDDASTDWQDNQSLAVDFNQRYNRTVYRYSKQRLGVAKAKNACLATLKYCEDVFLFDDDCFPQAKDWEKEWLHSVDSHVVGHSSWNMPVHYIDEIGSIGMGKTRLSIWNHCTGVCLHFTRECLNALGGYDTRGQLYGYEHAQISQRAHKAGFTKYHPYICPTIAKDLIFSLDIHYGCHKMQPPLSPWNEPIIQSVSVSEAMDASKNAFLMSDFSQYIPLEDPIL